MTLVCSLYSWHGTSPIFAADYQPWTSAQLRKALAFPNPSNASAATPIESSSLPAGLETPGKSARTPVGAATTDGEEGGGPLVDAASQGQTTPTPVKAVPVDGAAPAAPTATATSGGGPSAAGFNPAAARAYRLATAGADSCVRVCLTIFHLKGHVLPCSRQWCFLAMFQIWTVYPNVTLGPNVNAATGLEIAPHPPRAVYAASLKRHTGAVNVVRWSPTGQFLASAGDDGTIIIWHQVESRADVATFGDDEEEEKLHEKEFWKEKRMIVATKQAIYDLAWSPDGRYIVAGSTDNLAQVFSVIDGSCVHQIQDHSHFVQGVAWDPLNEYLATQSSDR